MTARLVIRLAPGATGPVSWLLTDDAGGESRFGRAEALDLLPETARREAHRVVLIVAGTDVLCRRVELPARTEAQARAAVGYLMEDILAQPKEDVHFTLGPAAADGWRTVCAVARTRMQDWLDALSAIGLDPDCVIPDYLLLGARENEAVAIEEDGLLTAALGPQAGFAAEADLARLVLPEALDRVGAGRVRLLSDRPGDLAGDDGWGNRQVEAAPAREPETTLRHMAQAIDSAAVTLRQGAFARRRWIGEANRALAAVAALGGLLAVAGALMLYLEGARYARLAAEAEARTERIFQAAVPEAGRIVNPAAQLASARRRMAGSGGSRFLELAEMLAAGIAAADGVRLESLRYLGEAGELRAELAYRDFSDLEAIRSAVGERGGRLEETAARQENGQILGGVRLEAAR